MDWFARFFARDYNVLTKGMRRERLTNLSFICLYLYAQLLTIICLLPRLPAPVLL